MWKSASRRVKSFFCKHHYSHNNVTREARSDKSVKCFQNISPAIFSRSEGYESQKGETFAQNDNETRKHDKGNISDYFDNLIGGGICAIGLYIIQYFSYKKVIFSQKQSKKCASDIFSRYTLYDYTQLVNYLTNSQPLHVLPNVVRPKKKNGIYNSEVNENEFHELEKAHRSVLGSLNNIHGANCMKKKNYTEAVVYFQEAAKVENSAGIYNLGVCYEIGWGINQDFKKAAEMYKRASDMGHPTATYNLGVFYVNGLGDLECDLNKARKLFQIAAGQGQQDAQNALDMEKSKSKNEKMNADEQTTISPTEKSKTTNEKQIELSCREYGNLGKCSHLSYSFIDAVKNDKAYSGTASSDDSGALDLSPVAHVLHN